MRLRIVSGELGGRYIEAPPGHRTRPTLERVREAWFSALGDRVTGARVLDLFAGSGALGIEALSRGAVEAHFVESDRRAAAILRHNLSSLGLATRSGVTEGSAFGFLRRLQEGSSSYDPRLSDPPFDLALADPPYESDAARRLSELFRGAPFAALLCIEHAPGVLTDETAPVWRRRYGDTELSFLARPSHPGEGEGELEDPVGREDDEEEGGP